MSHTLPPHRELPPEVRGRMRATVRAGIPPAAAAPSWPAPP